MQYTHQARPSYSPEAKDRCLEHPWTDVTHQNKQCVASRYICYPSTCRELHTKSKRATRLDPGSKPERTGTCKAQSGKGHCHEGGIRKLDKTSLRKEFALRRNNFLPLSHLLKKTLAVTVLATWQFLWHRNLPTLWPLSC